MLIAAILLFGAGTMVEICAVLLAPLGFQDDRGFHAVVERRDDKTSMLANNAG